MQQVRAASGQQEAALQADLSALQQRMALAEADLAAAQERVQQLEQQLQSQQVEAAANQKRMSAQMEQLKMDVSVLDHQKLPDLNCLNRPILHCTAMIDMLSTFSYKAVSLVFSPCMSITGCHA